VIRLIYGFAGTGEVIRPLSGSLDGEVTSLFDL
jgi:hypothetical protein